MKTLNVKKMSIVSNLITPYKKIGCLQRNSSVFLTTSFRYSYYTFFKTCEAVTLDNFLIFCEKSNTIFCRFVNREMMKVTTSLFLLKNPHKSPLKTEIPIKKHQTRKQERAGRLFRENHLFRKNGNPARKNRKNVRNQKPVFLGTHWKYWTKRNPECLLPGCSLIRYFNKNDRQEWGTARIAVTVCIASFQPQAVS